MAWLWSELRNRACPLSLPEVECDNAVEAGAQEKQPWRSREIR